ncbi:MAG: hypothetical protein ACK5LM_00895, partial [Lactovum sp.]
MPKGKINRTHREKGFTQIDNELLRDKEIGFAGVGMLSYILSFSESYTIYKTQLQSEYGRALVDKTWQKCSEVGYIISFKKYSS